MAKIAIIGGEGYIGSYLAHNLCDEHAVVSYDIGWFTPIRTFGDIPNVSYRNHRSIMSDNMGYFDVIIWAAGHSSVKMCDLDPDSAQNNNVEYFNNFLHNINDLTKPPLIIYMSSSSVYGKIDGHGIENYKIDFSGLNSPYDKTMFMREQIAESYNSRSNLRLIGLRLGTVCGFSPNQREELMINSMVKSALETNEIWISNPETRRAILYNRDLLTVIRKLVFEPIVKEQCGIYNVSSLNSNVDGLAKSTADCLLQYGLAAIIREFEAPTSNYSFYIETIKLRKTFNIQLDIGSPSNMVRDIVYGYKNRTDKSIFGDRNETREFKL